MTIENRLKARAAIMRSIRKTNTRPEVAVRRQMHALGYRFRLHRQDLPGSPDLVLPRHRVVVLVNGCFWHQHGGCKLARKPKGNHAYWLPKLARNVQRDEEVRASLIQLGWRVVVVWECETADQVRLRSRMRQLMDEKAIKP